MSAPVQLSEGVLERLYNNEGGLTPILQVLDVKEIKDSGRFRLVVSDSKYFQQAMLASQLGHLVQQGRVKPKCFVKVTEYITNPVQNKRVIIVLQLEVMHEGDGSTTVGNPKNIEAVPPAQLAPPQQQQQQQSDGQGGPPNRNSGQGQGQGGNSNASSSSNSMSSPPQNRFGANMNRESKNVSPGLDPSKMPIQPIAALNPYQNRWAIKGRVTFKGDMRNFNNARGAGKLFSVDLLDEHKGQIKATMFGEAAEMFFEKFHLNKVYIVSRGALRVANKRFNNTGNEYEIQLNKDAYVEEVADDSKIEQQRFDFTRIEDIMGKNADAVVDVIGIVEKCHPKMEVESKSTHKMINKQVLVLADKSNVKVDVTIWGGDKCFDPFEVEGHVLAIRRCKVSDFNNKSLNAGFGSTFHIDPDRPEAIALRTWEDTRDKSVNLESISQSKGGVGGQITDRDVRKTWAQVKEEHLGENSEQKADWFTLRGTVSFVSVPPDEKKSPWYLACPETKHDNGKQRVCNKKVIDDQNGGYRCELCNKNIASPVPRYILSMLVGDFTGSNWVTAFDQEAEKLLTKPAKELMSLKAEAGKEAYEAALRKPQLENWVFKMRAKREQDSRNDGEQRIRYQIAALNPVNFKSEASKMLDEIERYG